MSTPMGVKRASTYRTDPRDETRPSQIRWHLRERVGIASTPIERVYALLARLPRWLMAPVALVGHGIMQARG